ncbi:MAG: aromatic ring-hydroxylating dioxygenase subunit alpha [Granulosicoccus sp.]|nr:aromatic ring-hydroxylating dioxygenase subunit alpha [Granulosicoccus sp.]
MTQNTELVRALDPRYYTDPDLFKQELNGVLARTWQFACHASEVATPGDYCTFSIASENLFCIRTHKNEIKAYYNVCQHRAHQLVQGNGNCRLIVCPYHAWTYELTGELRGGPNLSAVEGLDLTAIGLTEVRLENFNGFLFANLDTEARPMDEWFPQVREELRQFVPQIDQLKPVEWIDIHERCNWKLSVENYSECYHCQLNHPTFSQGIVKADTYDIQPQGHCLRHTTECQNLDQMSYEIDLDANEYAGKYSSWYLWPLMSFQVYPGNLLNTYHWRTIDHEQVVVWRGWYSANPSESEMLGALAKQDRTTTVEEDIHLVESAQKGMGSRGYSPGPLVLDPAFGVKSEHPIKVLHEWMRDGIQL